MMFSSVLSLTTIFFSLSYTATAVPTPSVTLSRLLRNRKDAQALNAHFALISPTEPCNAAELPFACVAGQKGQCVNSRWVLTPCSTAGQTCVVSPLTKQVGTSITCDSPPDALAQTQAAGARGGLTALNASTTAGNSTTGGGQGGSTGADGNSTTASGDHSGNDCNGNPSNSTSDGSVSPTIPAITTSASRTATLAPIVTLQPPSSTSGSSTDSGNGNSTGNGGSASPEVPRVTISASRTAPATLAPSVTLPPQSSVISSSIASTTSALTSAPSPAPTLFSESFATTVTLSPASASALISSLEANDPNGITFIPAQLRKSSGNVADSDTGDETSTSIPITSSFGTTAISLTAASVSASVSASGSGYNPAYRVRRMMI